MIRNSAVIATLEELGVHFFASQTDVGSKTLVSPETLIYNLASSKEARMRLALIPLFLKHPHYAEYVKKTLANLSLSHQDLLRCYYTAAQLLQIKYRAELLELFGQQDYLPVLFDDSLKLDDTESPDTRLHQLARRQAELSGRAINWYGTYKHAYTRLTRHTKWNKQWQS